MQSGIYTLSVLVVPHKSLGEVGSSEDLREYAFVVNENQQNSTHRSVFETARVIVLMSYELNQAFMLQ